MGKAESNADKLESVLTRRAGENETMTRWEAAEILTGASDNANMSGEVVRYVELDLDPAHEFTHQNRGSNS